MSRVAIENDRSSNLVLVPRQLVAAAMAGVLLFAVFGKVVRVDFGLDGLALIVLETGLGIWLISGFQSRYCGIAAAMAGVVWFSWNVFQLAGGETHCECFGTFAMPVAVSLGIDLGFVGGGLWLFKTAGSRSLTTRPEGRRTVYLAFAAMFMAGILVFVSRMFSPSFSDWSTSLIGKPCPAGLRNAMSELDFHREITFVLLSSECLQCAKYMQPVFNIAALNSRLDSPELIRAVYALRTTGRAPTVDDEPLGPGYLGGSHVVLISSDRLEEGFPGGRVIFPCLIRTKDGKVVDCVGKDGLDWWLMGFQKGIVQ